MFKNLWKKSICNPETKNIFYLSRKLLRRYSCLRPLLKILKNIGAVNSFRESIFGRYLPYIQHIIFQFKMCKLSRKKRHGQIKYFLMVRTPRVGRKGFWPELLCIKKNIFKYEKEIASKPLTQALVTRQLISFYLHTPLTMYTFEKI